MNLRCPALAFAVALSSCAWGQASPWTALSKTGDFSVSYVSQSADNYWRGPDGAEKGKLGFGPIDQTTLWLQGTYGISDIVALDVEVGNSETTPGVSPPPPSDGRTDFTAGLTWRILDEDINERGLPSVGVRGAMVLAGNYDVGLPTAIGDGANGFDASVVVGKFLTNSVATSAEYGLRTRGGDVPNSTFVNLNGYLLLSQRLILEAQWHRTFSDGNLHICGSCGPPSPPGDPSAFPRVAEEVERVAVGATFNVTRQLGVGGKWFQVIDGRNAAEFDALAIDITYTFDFYGGGG